MRKPDQIRAIFMELRTALGPEVPAGDLLRIAFIIFRSYKSDFDELGAFGRPRESRSIIGSAVDRAISDGGWQVLEFERLWLLDNVDHQESRTTRRLLVGQLLGPGWENA
jgi:hypothetical protein